VRCRGHHSGHYPTLAYSISIHRSCVMTFCVSPRVLWYTYLFSFLNFFQESRETSGLPLKWSKLWLNLQGFLLALPQATTQPAGSRQCPASCTCKLYCVAFLVLGTCLQAPLKHARMREAVWGGMGQACTCPTPTRIIACVWYSMSTLCGQEWGECEYGSTQLSENAIVCQAPAPWEVERPLATDQMW
jgi:hypothetical protein